MMGILSPRSMSGTVYKNGEIREEKIDAAILIVDSRVATVRD
jgi:hypothetical protein